MCLPSLLIKTVLCSQKSSPPLARKTQGPGCKPRRVGMAFLTLQSVLKEPNLDIKGAGSWGLAIPTL